MRRVSRKNWVSKSNGVVSKGTASCPGMIVSERATVCDARRWTTSAGVKPVSAKRSRILSTLSAGPGIAPSSAGPVAFGRPTRNCRRGAPGQFVSPKAAANWMRSPPETLCLVRNGASASTPSSVPAFSEKVVSTGKRRMEPSAPSPWNFPDFEKETPSWNVRRRDSWTSSPH